MFNDRHSCHILAPVRRRHEEFDICRKRITDTISTSHCLGRSSLKQSEVGGVREGDVGCVEPGTILLALGESQQEKSGNITRWVYGARLDGNNLGLHDLLQIPACRDGEIQVAAQRAVPGAHSRTDSGRRSAPVPFREIPSGRTNLNAVNDLAESVGSIETWMGENCDEPPAAPGHARYGSEYAGDIVNIHQAHHTNGSIKIIIREPRENASIIVDIRNRSRRALRFGEIEHRLAEIDSCCASAMRGQVRA